MSTSLTITPFLGTPFPSKPHKWRTRLHPNPNPKVSSNLNQTPQEDDQKPIKNDQRFNLFHLSVTLTVISTSLSVPQPVMAATNVKKKRAANKPKQVLTSEQLKKWYEGLPIVKTRIPFSEILSLRELGKVKHVVKPSSAMLSRKPEWVLVVLDDGRVLRSVLPSYEANPRFWQQWDVLGMDSFCINSFSPPVKTPEVPTPYFGFVSRLPEVAYRVLFRPKTRSKKAMELKRMREELRREREEELMRGREEREMIERVSKQQKRAEEREKRRELRRVEHEESMRLAEESSRDLGLFWATLASDPNVANALGCLFFYIFYRTVVLNYKKQKKDYEDRLKIERAEAEERKKMRELERRMQGFVGSDEEEDEGNGGGGGGEEDPYMKMATQFMKSGARVRRAGNRRLPQYLEADVDVKFSDVAGLGKIRVELEEIVKFFTHAEMYRRRGVKMPGGILLCGPPGVGKTLLAKAVAGEAGVNFFSISASQFVEIYVGVGASRVKALYQEARENAPAVVFIDELDAVGRERGLIKGSGGQERDATLNQLLVCLDGFEGRGDVITIASTNRPDILDPALVRPGRFDRKIYIPKPSLQGRVEILQVHARKKPMAEDVDYMAVAGVTDGMVGAELANIIEVAAINMLRDRRSEITTDDLLQAAQMEERGMLVRKERSLELWGRIALNEAAQAITAVNFPDLRNIEFLNIAPRAGRELGYVRFKMDHVKFREGMMSRQSVLDHITVQIAPRAADEIWFGEDQLSTIWAETADNARSAARTLVLVGLSEKHHGLSNFWTADKINDIDVEALKILNMCYERAKKILQRNRELVNAVVNELTQKKSMNKKEFFHLVELHGSLEPAPLSVLDIRADKIAEFQRKLKKEQEKNAIGSTV